MTILEKPNNSGPRNSLLRALEEIRQFTTVMESYFLDNEAFPPPLEKCPYGLHRLTTPIDYLPNLPADPFSPPGTIRIRETRPRSTFYYIYLGCWIFLLCALVWTVIHIRQRYSPLILSGILLVMSASVFFDINIHYALSDIYKKYRVWKDPYVLFEGVGIDHPIGFDHDPMKYGYFYALTADKSAIIASPGPDFVLEFSQEELAKLSRSDAMKRMSTYWPTNGIESRGDIWVLIPGR